MAKSIETGAKLALELCTACQKYWVIKKLFWEVLQPAIILTLTD